MFNSVYFGDRSLHVVLMERFEIKRVKAEKESMQSHVPSHRVDICECGDKYDLQVGN